MKSILVQVKNLFCNCPKMLNQNNDEKWMEFALREAQASFEKKEVPIGAVVVFEDKIIGRGHNQVETLNDPTAHAEILAIGAASNYLNSWRLEGCSLYVTVEPCSMCAGAIVLSRMERLIFGVFDKKAGACGSIFNIVQDIRLNHQVLITPFVKEKECAEVLQRFFQKLREKKD
jgi:tRNA(adenine34) deaminase